MAEDIYPENHPFGGVAESSNQEKYEAREELDSVIRNSKVFNILDSKAKVVDSQTEGEAIQVGSNQYYNKLLNSTPEELVKDYNLGLK